MRAWWLLPERRMAIGAAAKCGSTTIRHAMTGDSGLGCDLDRQRVYFDDIPAPWSKVGVVRHPVDRFYSLYANIQERRRSAANFYAQFENQSPWDVFDGLIRAGLDYDIHFQPQTTIGLENADELVRLEDLNAWWLAEFGTELEIRNRSNETRVIDPRVADRVLARYEPDLKLWERAGGQTTVSA